MRPLPHHLDRTVVIHAKPETVFQFFTDNARWAGWWGPGSTIHPQPGGKVYIHHPNGIEVTGEITQIAPPALIAFTYGYASGQPFPPGDSLVTIRLEPDTAGTRLHLRHEFAEPAPRDLHVQGWRFQLSLFANVVANEVFSGVAATVDSWFEAWTTPSDESRDELLTNIAAPGIQFHDRFSLLQGLEDLTAHMSAARRFMPGMALHRKGDVRHCQGTVLANWSAQDTAGNERMSGASVFVFNPDGRIRSVTSVSDPQAP